MKIDDMNTYKHSVFVCPQCEHVINAASLCTDTGQAREPRAGDWAICASCAAILRYTGKIDHGPVDGLRLSDLKEAKDTDFELMREILKAQHLTRQHRDYGKPTYLQ